jgi:hypothetical protein
MNLEPNIWGPHYWATFHFMSSTYDNNPNQSIQSTMKTFIQSLPVFLPCKECQDHAFEFIKSVNLNQVVQNRKELFTFFFNFHNSVNQRLKKPLMKIEDALNKYYVPVEDHHLYLPSKGRVPLWDGGRRLGPVFGSSYPSMSPKIQWNLLFFVMVVAIIVFLIKKNWIK